MNRKALRFLCLLLAVMTAFSVSTASFSAAESEEVVTAQSVDGELAGVGELQPEFISIDPCNEGIVMRWNQLENIYFYRIDRYFDDGRGWVKLQDTDLLEYTDVNVASGNTYQYRLVGVSADGNVLTKSAIKSIEYYASVKVSNAETIADGIRVSWKTIPGMSKAALYRKVGNSWSRIATTADTSYVDRNVIAGNAYTYTVRSLDANGAFLYDFYDNVGVTHSYVAPPSIKVDNAVDGVKISWGKVEGAENYRIFYRNSSGGWSRLTLTNETSFIDKDVRSGKSYTYTVRCTDAGGERYTSYFDTSGKSVKYIAAPVLVSADGTSEGIRVTWKASAGADRYRVFRKDNGTWKRLGDTDGTSYVDKYAPTGSSTYTVRCMNSYGEYISTHYAGISGTYLSEPVITVSNDYDGVKISWKAISGAAKYRVYCYGTNGWAKIADTVETSFIDTVVTSGNSYTYTVRCINEEGNAFTSGYNSGKSTKFVAAPKISGLENDVDGVKITWGSVRGAEKYRLYYYAADGWKRVAETTSHVYVDKNAVSGNSYRYTVRCVNNTGTAFLSNFRPGETITYIAAPDFKLYRNAKTVTITWDKVQGAELYRIYHRDGNIWRKITDTKSTSYEDKTVESGNSYTYTVRCMNADATVFTSSFRPGKTIKIVDTPYVSSVSNGEKGVDIKWGAVKGAEKYRVYYKTENDWVKVGETAESEFTHTAAESGREYTYTVRCINEAGTAFESSFDRVGKSLYYIAAPRNLKAVNDGNGIRISWKLSEGAAKYRIYYYGSKGWTRMKDTTDTSYVDTDVTSGKTYRYTVRCLSADGKSFTSNYNHDGVSCKYTSTPVLQPLDYTKDGVVIKWNEAKGTDKYRVYTYGDKGWTKIADTSATTVIDKSVSSGKTYRYTVRGISADGKSFTSDYDHQGVSIYYVAAPKLLTMESDAAKVVFSWSKPRGAERYRVYKKSSGTWKRLGDTSSNQYTDKNISVGNTYTYTVRVINNDGTEFYSGYDPAGFVVTVSSDVSDFRYYDQTQYNYPYGDDTIAYSGCGPTSFAMVASTLTGKSITPIDAVAWCGNSYYLMGVGTYWSYFKDAADYFGVKMEKQLDENSFSSVITALKQGKYVISAQRAGRFTSGGHFIVLAGITSDGKVIVYDPNGGNHYVGTAFDPSEVSVSGTQYWVFSK